MIRTCVVVDLTYRKFDVNKGVHYCCLLYTKYKRVFCILNSSIATQPVSGQLSAGLI